MKQIRKISRLLDKLHSRMEYIQNIINNSKCDKDTIYKIMVETSTARVELAILEKMIKQLIDKN